MKPCFWKVVAVTIDQFPVVIMRGAQFREARGDCPPAWQTVDTSDTLRKSTLVLWTGSVKIDGKLTMLRDVCNDY